MRELAVQLEKTAAELGRTKVELAEMGLRRQLLEGRMDGLEAEHKGLQGEKGRIELEFERLEGELRELHASLDSKAALNAQLQKELAASNQRNATLKERHRSLKVSHDHFAKECEDLQSRGAHLNIKIYQLEQAN